MKLEHLWSENDLQLLIVDAHRTVDWAAKNQRDYYFGKVHVHTIKIEVFIDPKGRILRISEHYEGRVHDFKIRKPEGPFPLVSILTDFGYQGF